MSDPITTINTITDVVNAVGDLSSAIAVNAGNIIAAASIAAALLPPAEGSGWRAGVHRTINRLAFNVKHARNANEAQK
jgi:hypothetical protein